MADKLSLPLEKKIKQKKVTLAVVGLGYVGLPLALEFARRGLSVIGIEVDRERISRIKKRESYITDISHQQLRAVLKTGRFAVSGDFMSLKKAEVIIICVPTPLKKKYTPDISYIIKAVKSIGQHIRPGSLVILESTTYPGTTEDVILPLLERHRLKHGKDFFLCFSPERIDPGNEAFPVHKIPKVIGGITPEATQLGAAVYRTIIQRVVPVSSARVAETVKLLENTFRLINIALVDELAIMAHKMDMDIWEIIDAAKTKPFGFMPFYPGPGVGGHCIPKDPLYLYWKARHFGFNSRFIRLASQVIANMPEYIVERVMRLLSEKGKDIRRIKVLVIGATYKKDVKDLRKSPALDIIGILDSRKISVSYYDPLIPYLDINGIQRKSVALDRQTVGGFDCVIIATDHTAVDYRLILDGAQLIFDARNVFKHYKSAKIKKL
jgi:UDP-N-acetyl-D-glucosamine dehydrogenase